VFERGRKAKYFIFNREEFPFLLKSYSPNSVLQVLIHPSTASNKITVIEQRIKKKNKTFRITTYI